MKWIGGISRAAMMGLAWAGAWVPVGALVGTLIVGELEPEHIGGSLYASFLCGAAYSWLTGIAAGRRTPAGLSLSLAGARGALSGLLVGGFWLAVVWASNPTDPQQWRLFDQDEASWTFAAVVGSLTLASAISGVGSTLVARALKKGASTNAA